MVGAARKKMKTPAKKKKVTGGHPTYKAMVLDAITTLAVPTGSSSIALEKHIKSNHKTLDFKRARLKLAMKKLVDAADIMAHPKHPNKFMIATEKERKKKQKAKAAADEAKGLTWCWCAGHSGSGCVPGHTIFSHQSDLSFFWGMDCAGCPPTLEYGFQGILPIVGLEQAKTFAKPILRSADATAEKAFKAYTNKVERLFKATEKPQTLDVPGGTKHNVTAVLIKSAMGSDMCFVLPDDDAREFKTWLHEGRGEDDDDCGWSVDPDCWTTPEMHTLQWMKDNAQDVKDTFEMIKGSHYGPPRCM